MKRIVLTAALLIAVAGCGGTANSEAADVGSDECEQVDEGLARAILNGKKDDVAGRLKLERYGAARSPSVKEGYVIAVEFDLRGVDDPVTGFWVSNSLERGGGTIMSVDAVAKEFTVWPDATEVAGLDVNDPAVETARDCLG